MAKFLTIARPYAQALFNYADEHHQIPLWLQVSQVLTLLAEHRPFLQLIQNPAMRESEQLQLIKSILNASLGDLTPIKDSLTHYLQLLIEQRRLNIMGDINTLFIDKVAAKESTRHVKVMSAFVLDTAQRQRLEQSLEKYFASKVDAQYSEDPNLIGGIKVESGSLVVERSIQNQLSNLRDQFRV